MLPIFFAALISFAFASERLSKDRPFLIARDRALGPSSSDSPFAVISYDIVKDVNMAHFRQASGLLGDNLELMLISDSVSPDKHETVMINVTSRVMVAEDDVDLAFHASLFLMGHPLIGFTKGSDEQGQVIKTYYKTCSSADEEGCMKIRKQYPLLRDLLIESPLDIRTGMKDQDYTVAYEVEKTKTCYKITTCSQASHIDILKVAYNTRMDEPAFMDQTFSLSLHVTSFMDRESNHVLTIHLLPEDNPECLWDIAKEFISRRDKMASVSRIFLKKFSGPNNYRLIIRLMEEPSRETFEQIRWILRPFLGPFSGFNELASDELKDSKLILYVAARFEYSDLYFSALGHNNNGKNSVVVKNEEDFLRAFAKTKREIGFRLARYFPDMDSRIPFHCAIKCPKQEPRTIFRQLAKTFFFPGNRWTDCMTSIEVRAESGLLMFHAYYYMLADGEYEMAHKVLNSGLERVYQELTGSNTYVTRGIISTRYVPGTDQKPKHAEVMAPVQEIESGSAIKPSLTKKCSRMRKKKKQQGNQDSKNDSDVPSTEATKGIEDNNLPATTKMLKLLDLEEFEACVKEAEDGEEVQKSPVQPDIPNEQISWIYHLTDEEYDHILSSFARKLGSSGL